MKHKCKLLLLLLSLLGLAPAVLAQYGFGTSTPAKGAAVDVTSRTMGFLLPRMTESELKTLAAKTPDDGMMVYNTTQRCLAYYNQGSFNCVSVPVLPVATTVTYGSSMKAGSTVTASYFYSYALGTPAGTPKFAWYSSTSVSGAGKTSLGVSTQTYTLPAGQVGKYIAVGVTPVASNGKEGIEVMSAYKQILAADAAAKPLASSISYTASEPQVCSKLTVSAVCTDEDSPVSAPVINWYYCTDAAGGGRNTASVGTGDSYTLKTADLGKYLIAGVTPQSTLAPIAGDEVMASAAIGPVTNELIIDHVAGDGVSPVSARISYGLATFGTQCWITQNLGATRPPQYTSDPQADTRGWYFRFDQLEGYAPGRSVIPASWGYPSPRKHSAGYQWTVSKDPCTKVLGPTWSLPSNTDLPDMLRASSAGLYYPETSNGSNASYGGWIRAEYRALILANPIHNPTFESTDVNNDIVMQAWHMKNACYDASYKISVSAITFGTRAYDEFGDVKSFAPGYVKIIGTDENVGLPVRCVRGL